MRTLLVTGSSGLIGSEVCEYFGRRGWRVHGIDNNGREAFFGAQGSTRFNQLRLLNSVRGFEHHEVDVRDRQRILELVHDIRPNAIVHTAAQPSHDLATRIPFADFETNANGTLNLLEAARQYAGEAPCVHLSTNKVYGDAPNELPLIELEKRWDYARPEHYAGIPETMRVDQSMHSLFGASKLAADIMVQEYGRYFGMPTCCLRGGCLTGPHHAGVELHGFLSYLVKCNIEGNTYVVYGYKGKQVRDNIHAYDVATFVDAFIDRPRVAEVYNLGGGRGNSCSILEAFEIVESISGRKMVYEYVDTNRRGDHICYISDLSKARSHYPQWGITYDLHRIVHAIYDASVRPVVA